MVSVLIPTISKLYLPTLIPTLIPEIQSVGGEIIIANNKAIPENITFLRDKPYTVFNYHSPRSFARSNNAMARYAKHEHLLLLNDDTFIQKGLIQTMKSVIDNGNNIGAVGCKIYNWQENKIQHAGIRFNDEGYPFEIRYEQKNHPNADCVKEVQAVTAACLMTTKTVWRKVKGLDERYVNGWEDNDFNLKVREAGYKIWYTGKASIRHHHFGSKDFGRMAHEDKNVLLYKKLWIDSGKVFKCVSL